jgi:cytochrome c oxidase subunit 2
MAGPDVIAGTAAEIAVLLAGPGSAVRGPDDIFSEIFLVFVVLGTLVGVVVIGYTLYNAYRYRDGTGNGKKVDENPPEVGELPTGGGGGKKLALSFALSALIVVGLIIWTYTALLYVDSGPEKSADDLEIQVTGFQFGWEYTYPNGESTTTLHAPMNQTVWLNVTSSDVFHNFGIRELGVKTDAIPGLYSDTWFRAEEPGSYRAVCYELCGSGHSYMRSDVEIHTQEAYQDWYDDMGDDGADAASNETEASS